MNWLDRLIAWIAPAAASRRVHARMSMRAAERLAYEGARTGRRTSGWLTPNTGPNAEIATAAVRLRARSRDLVRNNPFAARAVAAIAANAVGTGIVARTQAREVAERWAAWTSMCDADGTLDWYGIQALVARTVVESGECLVYLRPRRPDDGIDPPLQLQVLEPDYLDASKTGPTKTGYQLQGIEYDKLGRRVAYWLYDRHPGDILPGKLSSRRVPADRVLHVYRKDRPGQERGVPWLAPVIVRARDLDDYEEAELVRKKIEACFSAFVIGGDPGRTIGAGRTDSDTGQRIERFEPGMITYLGNDEDVRFATPQPSAGYPEYVRHQLRAIAVGIGVPYELLTGDLSQVNYSSIRAGLLEFRRTIEQFRWMVLIPQLCQPVWQRFTSLLSLGAAAAVPVTWTPSAWESVDPQKEAAAVQMRIRNGLTTWREAVSEMGYDADDQLEEIQRTNEAWDQAGIVLDCDPRKVSRAGVEQKET